MKIALHVILLIIFSFILAFGLLFFCAMIGVDPNFPLLAIACAFTGFMASRLIATSITGIYM